jgi:phosphoribosylaminoimidazolecarboxamide formyltransferase/IMP cyclohydrolase
MSEAPIALLSVYDKTGLLPFAKSLKELGFRLLGSGGTAKMIREAGLEIQYVTPVSGADLCSTGESAI